MTRHHKHALVLAALRGAAQDYFDHSPLPRDPDEDDFSRRAWESRHRLADILAERDVCHGCKRDLPDGTRRLMVFSYEWRGDGMRQFCEDCERKGKDRPKR